MKESKDDALLSLIMFYFSACLRNCKECTADGRCTVCKEGHYGLTCGLNCPTNCVSCTRKSGQCTRCVVGKFGRRCNTDCPQGCSVCDGRRCLQCLTGHFGADCEQLCPRNCNGTCKRNTGICKSCNYGYFGEHCEHLKDVTNDENGNIFFTVIKT